MSLFPSDVDHHELRPKILERRPARRLIGIIFTPRSGSSWLTEVLSQDRRFGKPQEWFNPNFLPEIAGRLGAKDPKDYVDLLRRQHHTQGVFSFEATLYQIDKVFKTRSDFLDAFDGTPIEWYYLTRQDIVLQAVSLAKAVNTGVFHAPGQSVEDRALADQSYNYNPREISKWLGHIAKLERRSEEFFAANQFSPLRISYEEIMAAGVAPVLDLFAAKRRAGSPASSAQSETSQDAQPFDTKHKKIGSSKNLEFATRFREENQEAVDKIENARHKLASPSVLAGVDPTLYIHIGAHKTGTTALQYRAKTGAEQLAEHGVLYPDCNMYHHGHHRLAFALKNQVDLERGDVPNLMTEVHHLRTCLRQAGLPKAFISSERLMVMPKRRIAKLVKALGAFDLRILAMVRRPDEYMLSFYNQMAKAPGNGFALSPNAFFEDSAHYPEELNFKRWIANWSLVVGQEAVSLLTYEAGDPTETVFAELGVPSDALPPARHLNTSLSARELSVMRAAKRAGLSVPMQKKAMDLSKKVFSGTNKPELTDAARSAILNHCEADLQILFKRFGQDNPYAQPDHAKPQDVGE